MDTNHTRNLVTDANDNLETAFEGLADHSPRGASRQFGSITAASSGIDVPLFNRIFVFESPSRGSLTAAVEWMTDRDVPFWVTATTPLVDAVGALAADLGLRRTDESQPGMALTDLDGIPSNESTVEITAVEDPAGLDDWLDITGQVFGLPPDKAREVTTDSILTDDRIAMFLGRVDDEVVASGQLVQSGGVAGVYTIGVDEQYRRRGIGEAMTWAVLRAGRRAGCEVGVLQSSEMGYSLYERMGFEPVVDYHHFEPAP